MYNNVFVKYNYGEIMGKLFDMGDDIGEDFTEIDDIAKTLRDALQHQADFVSPDAQHILVVTEILCTKIDNIIQKYDEFLYKIPQDL